MGVDKPAKIGTLWFIPAPPRWPLDEAGLIIELSPGPYVDEDAGTELWRALVAVRAWSAAGLDERKELFTTRWKRQDTGSASTGELAGALATFERMRAEPDRISTEEVAAACRAVAVWAQEHALLQTAIHFAEAGASADQESAALANLAARVCRRAGERARAEIWHDRAIGLARTTQNVRAYIEAHRGLGRLHIASGRFDLARPHLERAARTARRKGLKKQAGRAYHELLGLSALRGRFPRAVDYARRAFRALPVHNARTPALAYDLAFLMVRMGQYGPALQLLSQVIPKITAPDELVVVLGTLARAAGGANWPNRFEDAAARVVEMSRRFPLTGAGALCGCAEGARLLGDWNRARGYAESALEMGREAGADLAVEVAETLLREIAQQKPGVQPMSPVDPQAQVLRNLAVVAAQRLVRWRGPTWRRRGPPDAPEEE
ncbi:MAG TPA: tetratricopeptide repeat protein [Longimicrobium sp.]|jgi:tetratricopeptide (TPR) repeat protein|uniref:tetratricopeptide repeat protein n=1 Tax=Longimicrobium sp. TaxID=2029185 RepID=UPI002ED888AE